MNPHEGKRGVRNQKGPQPDTEKLNIILLLSKTLAARAFAGARLCTNLRPDCYGRSHSINRVRSQLSGGSKWLSKFQPVLLPLRHAAVTGS